MEKKNRTEVNGGWKHKLKEQRRVPKKTRRTRVTRQRTNRRRRQRKKGTHLAYESEIRRTNGTATLAYL